MQVFVEKLNTFFLALTTASIWNARCTKSMQTLQGNHVAYASVWLTASKPQALPAGCAWKTSNRHQTQEES